MVNFSEKRLLRNAQNRAKKCTGIRWCVLLGSHPISTTKYAFVENAQYVLKIKLCIRLISGQSLIRIPINRNSRQAILSAISWCRWRGSNPHGVTTNGFWVHLVCQFQHTGVCNGHYIIGYRIYSRKSSIFSQGQSFIFKTYCAISTKAYFVVKTEWRTESTHHLIPIHFFTRFWAFRRRHIFEKFTIDF